MTISAIARDTGDLAAVPWFRATACSVNHCTESVLKVSRRKAETNNLDSVMSSVRNGSLLDGSHSTL